MSSSEIVQSLWLGTWALKVLLEIPQNGGYRKLPEIYS